MSPMPLGGRACGHPRPGSSPLHSKAPARHMCGTRVCHGELAGEPRGPPGAAWPVRSTRDPAGPSLSLGSVVRCQALSLHQRTCIFCPASLGRNPGGTPSLVFSLHFCPWGHLPGCALGHRPSLPPPPCHCSPHPPHAARGLPARLPVDARGSEPAAALSPAGMTPLSLGFVLFDLFRCVPLG